MFWSAFLRLFSRDGCPSGAFWETFRHFLEVCGLLLDATPSQAKTTIFRFWRSQVGTCSSTFPGPDSECVFNGFYAVFCDFGSPLGSLLAPFGPPFLGELAVRFRIGEKVASGVPKESLFCAFGHHLGGFLVIFRRIQASI